MSDSKVRHDPEYWPALQFSTTRKPHKARSHQFPNLKPAGALLQVHMNRSLDECQGLCSDRPCAAFEQISAEAAAAGGAEWKYSMILTQCTCNSTLLGLSVFFWVCPKCQAQVLEGA